MGREVRMVPPDWEHPTEGGRYKPLYGGSYADAASAWDEECEKWCTGWRPDYAGEDGRKLPSTPFGYAQWDGDRPSPGEYMPDWPAEERTHYQMYEDTTEGTPISPVFEGPESLARWLADNNASAYGGMTAPYEDWLFVIVGPGSASGCMLTRNEDGSVTRESGVALAARAHADNDDPATPGAGS